jgi:hypothetical protein
MGDKDFAKQLWEEYRKLKNENQRLKKENIWIKKVLEMALGGRVLVVREKEINSMPEPVFNLDENLENDLLISIIKKGDI